MYPIFRLIKERICLDRSKLGLFETHVSRHICWPWDLDPWMELNNGRTLTLYDLGRIPWSLRLGMIAPMRDNRWGMTVAGSTPRYRRRVRMFQRFETHSALIGWDHRFLYMQQSMWRGGEALNHVLLRLATTDAKGIVAPQRLISAMGYGDQPSPELPDWVQAWIEAEAQRPWPPMQVASPATPAAPRTDPQTAPKIAGRG
ncbi:acyl-CoA thioesterase [Pararhodobacter oceanensis]|uniref:Thioeseterase n=1 Tax=Pararhodobacter oceanensis TaxID=2172121 RepID=A0A2T8HUI4_9RHOB|nr:acyl-CoA thioesterase [Pararhodobacter oceanensis]PVH29002.1 thioeseterase [Pararhodobacter oceanensis]